MQHLKFDQHLHLIKHILHRKSSTPQKIKSIWQVIPRGIKHDIKYIV